MSKDLEVGELSAWPREKTTGVNTLTVNDKSYEMPTYLINGVVEGPTLVLTGGVHAVEYASIAAALELGQPLDPRAIKRQVIGLPVWSTRPGFHPVDRCQSNEWRHPNGRLNPYRCI